MFIYSFYYVFFLIFSIYLQLPTQMHKKFISVNLKIFNFEHFKQQNLQKNKIINKM